LALFGQIFDDYQRRGFLLLRHECSSQTVARYSPDLTKAPRGIRPRPAPAALGPGASRPGADAVECCQATGATPRGAPQAGRGRARQPLPGINA
jgi:hypothetical protein